MSDDLNVAEPSKKKPRNKKKTVITVAVIAVVVAIAGGGFWAYHNTPGFCGDICHNSMDGYVPTLYAKPGQATVDKWGNQVADAKGMLAASHHEYAGTECLGCHTPVLEEQITEGLEYITGNYYAPLSERNLDRVMYYQKKSGTEFCLNSSCHNMTKSDLTVATEGMTRNPHSWHHFEYTCSDCHKSHRASVMVCTQCHDDSTVPQGWLSWEEAKNLNVQYGNYDDEKLLA